MGGKKGKEKRNKTSSRRLECKVGINKKMDCQLLFFERPSENPFLKQSKFIRPTREREYRILRILKRWQSIEDTDRIWGSGFRWFKVDLPNQRDDQDRKVGDIIVQAWQTQGRKGLKANLEKVNYWLLRKLFIQVSDLLS